MVVCNSGNNYSTNNNNNNGNNCKGVILNINIISSSTIQDPTMSINLEILKQAYSSICFPARAITEILYQ
ncbi:MAG: hypothetical protein ACRCVG_03215 [Methanobacteriaceae archaeon]